MVDENLELGSRVEVSARSQGELVLALGSETEPLTRLAVLTEIGSQLVLSVQNKASWYILGLDLDEGGQRLVVHALSLEMVQQAVETGALHGDTAEFSFDQQVIELTESSTGLADFLLENPQHFQTQVAVLEKAGEGE
ncbi:MAG: hypothetical protein GY722_10560 [bacterium]|nr:hypothetical protein [bacterium]